MTSALQLAECPSRAEEAPLSPRSCTFNLGAECGLRRHIKVALKEASRYELICPLPSRMLQSFGVARGPLLQREINQLARAALKVRQAATLDICLLRGTACAFYGMQNHVPHDVNLVVMKGEDFGCDDPEAIEHLLVRSNARYFLVDS
ncbi:hypothetical protein BKA70DRAFT_1499431 [Coprinopsis sp. MPI-PUGE-AT-0042]|nr:hypothetical protein BKA70DRAFT_1499431 [Coprinopsis sp. MPI-PUGE-AT-0042]